MNIDTSDERSFCMMKRDLGLSFDTSMASWVGARSWRGAGRSIVHLFSSRETHYTYVLHEFRIGAIGINHLWRSAG